jgi:cytoskeletal protein RodZ
MNESTLRSLLFSERGVVALLVVSAGVLGAGFGVLPGLLDGGNDAPDASVGDSTETTPRATATTDGPSDETTAAATGGKTPSATATPETISSGTRTGDDESGDGTPVGDGASDERSTNETDGDSTDANADDGSDWGDFDWGSNDREDDSGPQVDVQAEANVTVASLTAVPVSAATSHRG